MTQELKEIEVWAANERCSCDERVHDPLDLMGKLLELIKEIDERKVCPEGGGIFSKGFDDRVDANMKCGFCAYTGGCNEGQVYKKK